MRMKNLEALVKSVNDHVQPWERVGKPGFWGSHDSLGKLAILSASLQWGYRQLDSQNATGKLDLHHLTTVRGFSGSSMITYHRLAFRYSKQNPDTKGLARTSMRLYSISMKDASRLERYRAHMDPNSGSQIS